MAAAREGGDPDDGRRRSPDRHPEGERGAGWRGSALRSWRRRSARLPLAHPVAMVGRPRGGREGREGEEAQGRGRGGGAGG
jgi:hypothetical protein